MHRWLRSLLIAIVAISIAVLLTFPLRRITPDTVGLFLIAAIIIVSRYEGPVIGILASLVSGLIFDWFFDIHPYHLDLNLATLIRTIVFLLFSLLVASLEVQRRRAISFLETTNLSLQAALQQVKQLEGILPICVHCKKIRSSEGSWTQMEEYIQERSQAEFSHGMCPDCYRQLYPEIYKKHHPEG